MSLLIKSSRGQNRPIRDPNSSIERIKPNNQTDQALTLLYSYSYRSLQFRSLMGTLTIETSNTIPSFYIPILGQMVRDFFRTVVDQKSNHCCTILINGVQLK
jgi:hypothetical protein